MRIRGSIVEATTQESRGDFIARGVQARAVALSGRQSTPIDEPAELVRDVEAANTRISNNPDLVPDDWAVWKLAPVENEFWEGSRSRIHTRLRYEYAADGWRAQQLRP